MLRLRCSPFLLKFRVCSAKGALPVCSRQGSLRQPIRFNEKCAHSLRDRAPGLSRPGMRLQPGKSTAAARLAGATPNVAEITRLTTNL